MRLFGRVLFAIVLVLFVVVLTFSVSTMATLSDAVTERGAPGARRSRHVAVFLPEPSTLFFDQIRRGARSAAAQYDLAVTFHPIGPDVPEFAFAKYSGIDGAIIYPYRDDEGMLRRLEELEERGIAVVLVEQDVADDWPWTFVGTNNFEMGRRIGTHLRGDGAGSRVVVVYSDKSPAVASEKELIELGITSVMGDRLAEPIIRRQTGLNPLDAEALTYQLVRSDPPVTSIVFTDNNDTLAALQVIIDLNLVGEVRVIGFGVTDAILDYLERGVLDATIAVNPERIGVDAMRVLNELIVTGNAPGYVDTGVEVIRGESR
jgi:ribose transport system substrate-binding protein